MTYAIKKDGEWREIFGSFKAVVEVNGVPDELSFPSNWLDLSTEEERAAIGIIEIAEPEAAPAGERVIGDVIEVETVEAEIEVEREIDGKTETVIETVEVDRPRRVWLTEAIRPDEQLVAVRTRRNALLAESDWTQLPDVPLSDDARAAWAKYRQALRDVPGQRDPFALEWPVQP